MTHPLRPLGLRESTGFALLMRQLLFASIDEHAGRLLYVTPRPQMNDEPLTAGLNPAARWASE